MQSGGPFLAFFRLGDLVKLPDSLEKSVSQIGLMLIAENAFFARRYAKSEPRLLCSK